MEEVLDVRPTPHGEYEALVHWKGFSESERSLELLTSLYEDAPAVCREKTNILQTSADNQEGNSQATRHTTYYASTQARYAVATAY